MKLGHLQRCGWTATMEVHYKTKSMTFLVVRRLRIHLPKQGTQVPSLVKEDPTCHGQLSLCAGSESQPLEPAHPRAHKSQLTSPWHSLVSLHTRGPAGCNLPVRLEPVLPNRGHCGEKPCTATREQSPLTAARKSPHRETKSQGSKK